MNIHELRKKFWNMRNDKALNSQGIYVDTLHAQLEDDGETLIGGEIWCGREKMVEFPEGFKSGLYS